MLIKRSQGRPCRGSNEVGRARIIECLQQARGLVACCVASQEGIIEGAPRPVVESYMREIKMIAQSDAENIEKLRNIIELLLRCYRSDTGIIRAYENVFRADKSKKSFIDTISRELAVLVEKLSGPNLDCDYKRAAVQGAITGMCEVVARSERGSLESQDPLGEMTNADKVRFIYTFIINGLPKADSEVFMFNTARLCAAADVQATA